MSFSSLRSTIESHFSTNWNHTDIEYENVPINLTGTSEYVSISVLQGDSNQSSLGTNGQYKVPGVVIISIFTSRDIGTLRIKQLADYVLGLYIGLKIDEVLFQVPKGKSIHNKTSYFQFNVTIPFYAFFNIN